MIFLLEAQKDEKLIENYDAKGEVLELSNRRIALNTTLKQPGLSPDRKISLLNTKEDFLQKIRDKTKIRDDLEEAQIN